MIIFPFFFPEEGIGLEEKPAIKEPKSDDDTALLDDLIGDKDIIDLDEKEKEEPKVKEDNEEDDEEDVELIEAENNRGLNLTKIKEKYPDFAKTNEFRELRNSYHREAKFTELFPTIEDAQEAAENNETFNKLNDDLINKGDSTQLLNSIKEASPEAFKKITTSFLDTVAKMDTNLYTEIVSPVVKRLARQINAEGQKYLKRNADSDDGKALVATARNILQYAFPDDENIDFGRDESHQNNEPSEKEKELTAREQKLASERFNSAYQVVAGSVNHNIDKQILNGLDPDGKLNDFTRDALLEKIKNEIENRVSADQSHLRKMNSLWKRAGAEGYSRESLSRIVSAYLERARPIIPEVRAKFRSTAIKGKVENNEEDKGLKIVNRGRSGRAPDNDGRVNMKLADPKKIDYRNTSDTDIFEGKIKLKG